MLSDDPLLDVDALVVYFDRALADTTEAHENALRRALSPYGIALDSAWYRRRLGLSIADLLAALPGATPLPHHAVIAAARAELLANVADIEPIPATLDLVRRARAMGLPCAVASGASSALVLAGLATLGAREMFDAVVVREHAVYDKPAPSLYLLAAQHLGVTPSRCLAVDDAAEGAAAAQAAGMRVLTVVRGTLVPQPRDDPPAR